MILVIGAGSRRVPGAVHHDIQKLPGIDIVCDIYDLPNRTSDKYQEIHMTHVLEHFPMKDVQRVLKIVWSLLEGDGRIYIEVPNFEWHAKEILRDPGSRQIVKYAYGGQLNRWDFHYNGFTPDILISDLIDAGFRLDDIKPNTSIQLWATKVSQS